LWLCFEANAGEANNTNNNTAAKIFFMLKMYHDPEASGSPWMAGYQIRNGVIKPPTNAKTGVN